MDYKTLCEKLRRIDRLGSIQGILFWDEQVNLPPESGDLRADQLAVFSEIIHREQTDPEIGRLLDGIEKEMDTLDGPQQAVIRDARKNYDRATKLPNSLVERIARAKSEGYHGWKKARESNDFAAFAPHLQTHLNLAFEEAEYLKAADPYNYWIDQFDPGMTREIIDPLFDSLRSELVPLVQTITNSPIQPDPSIFKDFPLDAQKAFLEEVLPTLGFNFNRGRIDVAVHPFCGGHPRDIRMTTRYYKDNPLDSWSSSMHEAGHALYEQGLPDAHAGTILGQAAGMAFHESQSRLWENQVGRSRAFWKHWEPRYRHYFPKQLENISSEDLYLAINRVAITPIRVDADEVTYNLHIMLRFRMEQALFSGKLAVADVPEAWNAMSEELLGYTPKSNKEGCLQDVHWSEGLFGYFPSYALGNLIAAQLWYTIPGDLPALDGQIEKAEFGPLLNWLREKVHHQGGRFQTKELVQRITGEELSSKFLIRYLKERYLPLYTA